MLPISNQASPASDIDKISVEKQSLNNCTICLENIKPASKEGYLNLCPNADHGMHASCMTEYLKSCQAKAPLSTPPHCDQCGSRGRFTFGQTIDPNEQKSNQVAKLLFSKNLNSWFHNIVDANNVMAIFDLEDLSEDIHQPAFNFIAKTLKKCLTKTCGDAQHPRRASTA